MPERIFEDPLRPFYERARDRIRDCDPSTFIGHAISALYEAHVQGIAVMHKYQPWNILVAIKWTLQEAGSIWTWRRSATVNDLHSVLNVLHEIEGNVRMPNEYEHTSLFMRHLAFQQFWLQHGASAEAVVRQDLLFSTLPDDHYFSRQLRRIIGLLPVEFVDLSFGLLVLLLQSPSPRVVLEKHFSTVAQSFPEDAVNRFFSRLSRSVPELNQWLTDEQFQHISIYDQMILPTPLIESPMIRTAANEHTVIFPTLVMRSLETAIYRTLRSSNAEQFGVRFGPIFENYVGRCITDAGLSFEDEASLQARLGGSGKCVDFLVDEADGVVLIDAKGVEMSPRGRISQRADLVMKAIRASALKAVEQGMATAQRTAAAAMSQLADQHCDKFLLVVTFDDLFLGSSGDFATVFGDRVLPRLERDYGSPLPIPLEHVFFVTVTELENLLAIVNERGCSISAIMRFARDQDAAPATQKFHFQQHLDEFAPKRNRLPMLEARFNELVQRCAKRVRLPNPPE